MRRLTRRQRIAVTVLALVALAFVSLDVTGAPGTTTAPGDGTFRSITTIALTAKTAGETFLDLRNADVRSVTVDGGLGYENVRRGLSFDATYFAWAASTSARRARSRSSGWAAASSLASAAFITTASVVTRWISMAAMWSASTAWRSPKP